MSFVVPFTAFVGTRKQQRRRTVSIETLPTETNGRKSRGSRPKRINRRLARFFAELSEMRMLRGGSGVLDDSVLRHDA